MPSRSIPDAPVLTLRELNRALLARQFLLERRRVSAVKAIEALGGLQAQWAPSPYVALWSRLAGFTRDQLTRPIDRGDLIKATLMRGTLHLVSAAEFPAYARASLDGRLTAWRPPGSPELAELAAMRRSVARFARTPRTGEEIRERIASHLPPDVARDERLRRWFLFAAVTTSGLVWDPTGGHFEHRTNARFVRAPAALRRAPRAEPAYDLVVRRHLAAFGPATVSDTASWSSVRVPQIRAALARLRGVRRFRDEKGRELFDLAAAPRPPADTDAPLRFLARFDAAILGHDSTKRERILPVKYKTSVIFSAEVWAAFLVDGFVAGRWTVRVRPRESLLQIQPFARLSRADRLALEDEGERLVRFYAPDSRSYGVRTVPRSAT